MQRSARGILESLVRIPSPTGEERAAAEAVGGWCADAGLDVVLAEPTAMQLVVGNRGLLNFRVIVGGASAHASSPALGRNAVTAAARIALELESIDAELARRPHPQFGPPTLTVGTIHGGTRP